MCACWHPFARAVSIRKCSQINAAADANGSGDEAEDGVLEDEHDDRRQRAETAKEGANAETQKEIDAYITDNEKGVTKRTARLDAERAKRDAPEMCHYWAWGQTKYTVHLALWLGSLELTTVASSVTLATMSPLFVALAATVLLGEQTSRPAWTGIMITVVGAAVIGLADSSDPGETTNAVLGDLMALGGAGAMAGYILIGRVLRRADVPNLVFAVPTYAVAAMALFVLAIVRDEQLTEFPASTWLIFAALVVGPQLLGHAMLTSVLDRLSATTVAVTTLFEPIGATVLAWIVLDEVPAALFWLGAPVVLLGLAVTLRSGGDDLSHDVMDTL